MRIVQITEDKVSKMSDCVEKMLHYGGRLMSCIKEMEGGYYGERNGNYGERSWNPDRMGFREPEWEDPEMRMNSRYGERRMRDSRGRFM